MHRTIKDNLTNINHDLKSHLELSFGIPKKGTPRLLSTTLFFLRIRIRQDHHVSALGEVEPCPHGFTIHGSPCFYQPGFTNHVLGTKNNVIDPARDVEPCYSTA